MVFLYGKIRVRIWRKVLFSVIVRLDAPSHNVLNELMKVYYNIDIGDYSYGCHKIDGSIEPGTVIGKYCSVAPGVRIGGMNHPHNWVSTHPILYDENFRYITNNENTLKGKVIIEDDVWIGFNSIILDGVKVGKGSVIGAGAVVTKDVMPYSIMGGVPARLIKYRFSEEIISELLKIDWTNWDEETLKNNIEEMKNVKLFIEKFK
ncbi:hypothetical protein BSK56_30730 [Paenibacillus borealis]|uniref:Acetyltransferase n=1 Tax=Paenibacillus borealis TaxID=160799 RepID=A0ABX3GUW7_PAEBO|nr:hypothetical protein BSK56_30730 [Paenibacillus borealis]